MGFRPSALEGVSERRGGALDGGVGAGLGLCTVGGRLQGLGPGAQQGKCWPCFLPFLCALPHCLLQGLPCCCWTPNRGWVPLGVGTPPLPQPPLRDAGPTDPAFTFVPSSLPPTPSGPAQLEGALVGRGSGPGSQQAPRGPSGQGKPGPAPF